MTDYIETYIDNKLWNVSTSCLCDSMLDIGELPKWWPDASLTLGEIEGIQKADCAGQAYMPAVKLFDASQHMCERGDYVLNYIKQIYGEIPRPHKSTCWRGLAVFYLSLAVELYCQQFNVDEVKEQLEKSRGSN